MEARDLLRDCDVPGVDVAVSSDCAVRGKALSEELTAADWIVLSESLKVDLEYFKQFGVHRRSGELVGSSCMRPNKTKLTGPPPQPIASKYAGTGGSG